jgi:diguanylate cyclase
MSMAPTSASAELTTRPGLHEAIADAVSAARLSGTAVALAYADVNDFRRVNDSLGSELGEELLSQVSARLRAAVRPVDLVAREGGEGFLILVRDLPIDARGHADAVGQRIADAMHAPFALGAAELLLDASVGISIFPDDAETP